MAAAIPVIYSPRIAPVRLNPFGRIVALLISIACVSVLIIAVQLVPDPSGMGTHTQMGMLKCAFFLRTGLPCPGCGMTTSFAWFARGSFAASLYIQPMGFILALLTVIAFWTGIYEAVTARPAHRLILFIPAVYYLYPLLTCAIIAWAWKIFIHKYGIDGW